MPSDVVLHPLQLLPAPFSLGHVERGVLGAVGAVDALHHRGDGLGVGAVVVGKLLLRPLRAVVGPHPIAVHQIDAARHIVVVLARGVGGTVGLHRLPHPRPQFPGPGRPARSPGVGFPACLGVGAQAFGQGAVDEVGVPGQSAEACGVGAEAVVVQSRQAAVVFVHGEPSHAVGGFAYAALHPGYHAEAPARERGVEEQRVAVVLHLLECRGELVGRHMVEVNHKRARIGPYAAVVASSLHHGLAYDAGAAAFHGRHVALDAFGRYVVATGRRLIVLAAQEAVALRGLAHVFAPHGGHYGLP